MSLESVRRDIDELDRSLGVKELAPFERFADLHRRRAYSDLCRAIGLYMGLPNAVRLGTTSDRQRFTTHALSTTDTTGRGTHGIVAQVSIPAALPMYGTPAFTAHVIDMLLSEGFGSAPADTAVALLAHEMSHVLLHALRHPNRDSEPFTDLVPIVLGFGDIVERGRVVSSSEQRGNMVYTSKVTYGYLTDSEFALARKTIRLRLAERIARKRAVDLLATRVHRRARGSIESARAISALIRELDSKQGMVKRRDVSRIVELHMPGYIEDQERILKDLLVVAAASQEVTRGLVQYSATRMQKLQAAHARCIQAAEQLATIEQRFAMDLRVLQRNQNVAKRVRRFLRRAVALVDNIMRPWRRAA